MVWKILEYENQFVDTEQIQVGEIPCLKFRPKGVEGPLPTVVYYHGWQSSKEFQRFKGGILATYGFQVIAPDALHHGERDPIDHEDPELLRKYLWEVIIQTVEESGALIQSLVKDHQADPKRIGVVGSSMGGFAASGVFVAHPELKCLVNLNGSCAWLKAEEIFRKRDTMPPVGSMEMKMFSQYDPMFHKDQLLERPILLLHGEEDSSVPIESQQFFYEEVSSLYADDPARLMLVEVPNMNHYVSLGMFEEALDWLKRYL